MTRPLISCIVPAFNAERYLEEALQSILNQAYRPIEVLVIDDGSTDDTATIVSLFASAVRYLWQPNAGPAAARNRGLSETCGELVAFLDADDVWHREKLVRQAARFEARPELDVSLTQMQNFWGPELRDEEERCRGLRLAEPASGYLTAAVVVRRGVFEKVGRFDESWRHVHDTEWFVRARDRGVVLEVLPQVLVYRRMHANNRSRMLAEASRDEYLNLMKARIGRGRPA